jgi:hypothetical protein
MLTDFFFVTILLHANIFGNNISPPVQLFSCWCEIFISKSILKSKIRFCAEEIILFFSFRKHTAETANRILIAGAEE